MAIYAAISLRNAAYLTQGYGPADPTTWTITRIGPDGKQVSYGGIEVPELTELQAWELEQLDALVFDSAEAFTFWLTQYTDVLPT
jgi:hypothetical protein